MLKFPRRLVVYRVQDGERSKCNGCCQFVIIDICSIGYSATPTLVKVLAECALNLWFKFYLFLLGKGVFIEKKGGYAGPVA